jgi:E3 ubiquitin-protein ligase RNF14
MADDLDEPEDDRAVELSAISAIYPELIIDSTDPFSASISIAVEPIEPLTVAFLPLENGGSQTGLLTPSISDDTEDQVARQIVSAEPHQEDVANQDIHRLSHLPPLTLKIHLQDGYPSQKPPLFHLDAETPWIPETKLRELRHVGSSIWEDMGRDQVVFSYIDHLREAAERSFDVIQKGSVCLEVSQNCKIALLGFDSRLKRAKFEQETFDCGVCLGERNESSIAGIPANYTL